MSLRDLDERLLPDLARRLDALLRRLPSPPEPQGPAPFIVRLRRLDDRHTRRGPFALLRDVPQLGALLIGLIVFVSGVTLHARVRPEAAPRPTPSGRASEPATIDDIRVGPTIGTDVATYVREARERFLNAANGAPDGNAGAVVSFTKYVTPEQVTAILGPVQVRRVLYRVPLPLPQTQPRATPVGTDVAGDAHAAFRREAAQLEKQAKENLSFAKTITNDPAQKREHERDAAQWKREAKILRGACACVYAVIVDARLRLLAPVAADPAVRVVDITPVGEESADYTFVGLLPEERVTVTGGNQEK